MPSRGTVEFLRGSNDSAAIEGAPLFQGFCEVVARSWSPRAKTMVQKTSERALVPNSSGGNFKPPTITLAEEVWCPVRDLWLEYGG
jgi:hypothetical protein